MIYTKFLTEVYDINIYNIYETHNSFILNYSEYETYNFPILKI